MDQDPPEAPAPAPPRALGEVRLGARLDGGATRLAALRQAGGLRALFPRPRGPALEATLLNTTGGLTGGDRMEVVARVGPGAHLVLTTQACERLYRAAGPEPARVATHLAVEEGARIDWLPQETILYEGSRLSRRLRVDLAPGATALLVEPLLLGRLARGEVLRDAHLRDSWEVRRDGAPVFADAVRLEGDVAALMDRAPVGGGARAMATVLLAGDGADAMLLPARALLPRTGGASLVRDGVLVARLLAPDGFALRAALIALIVLLSGAPLPKVWKL